MDTDDFGQAIVAVGDPDAADHVLTYVPGLYSHLGGARSGLDKVEDMVANTPPPGSGSGVQRSLLAYDH